MATHRIIIVYATQDAHGGGAGKSDDRVDVMDYAQRSAS